MSRIAVATALVMSLFSFSASAERIATEPSDPIVDVATSVSDVRSALAARRQANLALFRAYEQAGVFPDNVYSARKLNVWQDPRGHFCAAANLVVKSGNRALADKVAEQTNFLKLGEVTQGPVMDWILTSGFTQDEIAMIQEPYMPVRKTAVVDAQMRRAENARLHALYKQIAARLEQQTSASLDAAAARLMKTPALARELVQGTVIGKNSGAAS